MCGTSSHVIGFQYVVLWGMSKVMCDEMGFERETRNVLCVVCSIFKRKKIVKGEGASEIFSETNW